MDIEHFKQRLLEKERELLAITTRLEAEARASGESDVRDSADEAASAQGLALSLQEGAMASQTLTQVRDALGRIQAGTFGKCIACGRPIEAARLEAVPWALYCVEDQERLDRAARVQQGGSAF